ncbi:MAG: S9 family peptidase, partial [Candidatus Limnocylindria bacterium]
LVNGQVAIESFDLSADGAWVVHAARVVTRGAYRSHLWVVPWEGGRPRPLTQGAVRDSVPAIAPDGRSVAFVRGPVGDEKAEPQVWVVPFVGGTPWQLTRLKHGAGTPAWSPDGRRVAFLAPAGADRFAVGPERKGRAPTARRITRTDFRDDESGNLGRRTHLWVVDARRGARPRQLTSGDYDAKDPAWAPDGAWLAFSADMGPDANIAPRSCVYRVSSDGGTVRQLAVLRGDASRPAVSPDGRRVAFLGTDVADPGEHVLVGLWVAPARGGPPRRISGSLDRSIACDGWADMVQADDGQGPVWLSDDQLLVLVAADGRNLPYRISLARKAQPLVAAGRVVGAGGAAAAGRVALSAGLDRHAAEVYALDDEGTRPPARLRPITRIGSSWQGRFPLPRWDELWVDVPGGPMQVWVASPAAAGEKPLPTILHLHGGPAGAWAPGGTMDSTLLCSAGYRVVMPNPRGSAAFGVAWTRALRGRWGEVDAADVLAAMDAMVARGMADPERLGVMGLSYGGFLTQWLVGATNRFRGAVAENGVANQVSTWANCHFGVHDDRRWKLGDPLSRAGMLRLWSSSPLSQVARIRTPLLMLQSEEDRICPAADNEQLFTALRVLGREAEYIVYPEEHHELKSIGRPDRRIDRMERILGWFDRWVRERPA